jgi:hypothetical protein
MAVKVQVLQVLKRLPDDVSLDDIQYRLQVIETVLRGKAEIARGKGITHAQAMKRLGRRRNIK